MEDHKKDVLIPEKRALEVLKMRKAHLQVLVKTGFLPCYSQGGKRFYHINQIHQLARSKAQELATGMSLPERVELLAAEVRKLMRTMRNMAHILGLPHLDFDPTDDELSRLYEEASSRIDRYTGTVHPSNQFVDNWLSVIPRLTESEFRRLSRMYPEDPHPWRVIWLLTEQMQLSLGHYHAREIDLDALTRRHRLSLALDVLRPRVLLYCSLISPHQDPRRIMDLVRGDVGSPRVEEMNELLEEEALTEPITALQNLGDLD